MRYIKRVRIQNFQNHKDTDIELEPGINLIVGSSQHGKSAALRAINWVLHNKPQNDKFIRHGTEEAVVTLWFNDGTIVTRTKGSKRNAAQITQPDGTELVFEKIGKSIPVQVIEALGSPPIDERHGPISYAKQLDPLFLTSLNTSDLPRSISELTGIDDFEEAVSILSKQSTSSKKTVKETQERISGYDDSLEKYIRLDAQLENLKELELDSGVVKTKISSLTNIDNMLSSYEVIFNTGRSTNKKLKQTKAIMVYDDDLQVANKLKNKIVAINKMIADNEQTTKKEQNFVSKIKYCEKIQTKTMLDTLQKAKSLKDDIKSVRLMDAEYLTIMNKGRSIKNDYDKWNLIYNNLVTENNELIDYMKDNGIWCNNCNRPLTQVHNCEKE